MVPQQLPPRDVRVPPSAAERLLVFGGAALFLYLTIFRRGTLIYLFRPAEGGVWIDEAYRVLDGQVMYRDFFEFLTPGIVYLNAAVMSIVGPRISGFGYAAVVLGAALTALIHALAARTAGLPLRLLPPVAFAVLLYAPYKLGDHKMPALFFGLLGLLVLSSRAPTVRACLAAGSLVGLGTLFTADFGVGIAGGTALYLALERHGTAKRAALAFLGGYAATIVLAMSYFVLKAGLATVLYDCLVFPLTRYREKNLFYVELFHHRGPRTMAQITLCVAGAASAVVFSRRNADGPTRLIAMAGLGLVLATAHRPVAPLDLAVRCAPLLIPLARALEMLSRPPRRFLWVSGTVLALLAAGIGWGSAALVARRQWLEPLTLETHRAGEVWTPFPMPEVSWIETNTTPGERVFLLPTRGGIHFLTQTRSATALPYVIQGQASPAHVQRVLTDIKAMRPAVGIWRNAAGLPQLYRALTDLYDRENADLNGHTLFRLKPDRGESGSAATPR